MNNILELCKIFHCHINDLVNDSILDVDSLDEEVKMSVIKFKKEQQVKMKGLSKAISVIAKIGRIAVLICIPILIVSMIIFGFMFSKIDVIDEKIVFTGNDTISLVEEDYQISVKINNMVFAEVTDKEEVIEIKDFLLSHSKFAVFGYVEVGLLSLIASLVLISIMLKSLENLFTNINQGDTPFTLENVGYIKKIAYLMIALTVLPTICGVIFEALLEADLDIGFELFSLVEILFLFSIAYIFQYGYEIQLDSKGKMYGEEAD